MKREGAEPPTLAWPNNSSERTAHSARFWTVRGFFPVGRRSSWALGVTVEQED
jgi:hypothetical protein